MYDDKPKDRIILHCDCNNFFASVEETLRPELRDVPMAVAQGFFRMVVCIVTLLTL